MSVSISLEELLSEIKRTSNGFEDGHTLRELKKSMGIGVKKLGDLLRDAIENGSVEVGRSERVALDGTIRVVPVYRVRKKK